MNLDMLRQAASVSVTFHARSPAEQETYEALMRIWPALPALLDVAEAAQHRVNVSANDTHPQFSHYVLAAALARLDRLAAPHKENSDG